MLQVIRLTIPAYNLYILRQDIDTYKVSLVPYIVGIHPKVVSVVGKDREVIMVTFVKQEVYFTAEFSILLVVQQVNFVKSHLGQHLVAILETLGNSAFPAAAEHAYMFPVFHFSLDGIAGTLLAHDLDIIRIDSQAFVPGSKES